MKKIIAAFDGLKFSESTKLYAIQLAKQGDAHLVGVFLEDYTYHSYKIYDLVSANGKSLDSTRKKWDRKDVKARTGAILNFEMACKKEGLNYTVHKDRSTAI